MNIIFMGTTPFAVPTLEALVSSRHTVQLVITQPDRPQGRGGKVASTPVKQSALQNSIPLLQPEKVRRRATVEAIAALQPDAIVVAAFGQLVPQSILDIPRYGCINVHGSLLPRWRGAAPMQYALISGDGATGVTTMMMDAGLDTGDILLKAETQLEPQDTLATVEMRLSALGAPLLLETLDKLEAGTCPRKPQEPAEVTLAPSLAADYGRLEWPRPARELHNLIRGVTPKPGAFTLHGGKRLKIWEATVADDAALPGHQPGTVQSATARGITVTTGDGLLLITRVQAEGKPAMAAADWARGARLSAGDQFAQI